MYNDSYITIIYIVNCYSNIFARGLIDTCTYNSQEHTTYEVECIQTHQPNPEQTIRDASSNNGNNVKLCYKTLSIGKDLKIPFGIITSTAWIKSHK